MKSHLIPEYENQEEVPQGSTLLNRDEPARFSSLQDDHADDDLMESDPHPANDTPIRSFLRVVFTQ